MERDEEGQSTVLREVQETIFRRPVNMNVIDAQQRNVTNVRVMRNHAQVCKRMRLRRKEFTFAM